MATTITANGINFPDGSAGSPSIGGTDTNTGLFTGSDIVGFATGGSERLRIDASGNVNIANDSGKLQLGTGADLQTYHNGTNSYVRNSTGILHVGGSGGNLVLEAAGDVNTQTWAGENMILAKQNGAVELYYDNSKKLETTSGGVEVFGELQMDDANSHIKIPDNARIDIGTGPDLKIYHDGSDSFIDDSGTGNLFIRSSQLQINKHTGENMIKAVADGKVELYHDNNIRFETTQYGAKITSGTNDNGKLEFKSGNHDYSCIGYTGLNRFAIDGHDGLEVRDPSDSYATRMKIGSDGKLHAFGNVASENAQLFQNISSTNPEGLYIQFTQAAPDTSARHFLKCSDNVGDKAVIDSNGNSRNLNNSYGGFSDVSLKENIVDASSQWNDIKNVKVKVFNFKKDDPSKKRIGVIAQEIETVCPKLVDEVFDKDSNGNLLKTSKKSVKYSVLYMKAIKALQEAMAKIETLETKVAALEA